MIKRKEGDRLKVNDDVGIMLFDKDGNQKIKEDGFSCVIKKKEKEEKGNDKT